MKPNYFPLFLMFLAFGTTVFSQTDKLESQLIKEFIEKKRDFNEEFGFGYRIQLYNGFEVQAKKMRAKFRLDFPDIKTFLIYQQPEWKIQIGHYKNRIQADKSLLDMKKKFPSAIVIPLGK